MHTFEIEMNLSDKIPELNFINRDTVALINVLKNKETDQTIIICNTHLFFNMKRGEIKLGNLRLKT